ncbi:hypothetical protein KR018_009749 [Drosophila ironensis]|nr:hypothetical protein KR018_009749 [Drosophila ironensis]
MAEATNEAQAPVAKPPPPPKPVDEKPEVNWASYWKNGGLISTKMVRKKDEYMGCSVKKNKAEQEKLPKKPICCSGCPVKTREAVYNPKCPGKGQKGKVNKEYQSCFACNIICQKLDMPGWEFECRDRLQMRINVCKGCKVVLDDSRINVNCLPCRPIATFAMESECLQRQLLEGAVIGLVYMNKEIARGCYIPPDAVIHRMITQFNEVVHDAEVELTCKGCTVGLCRIRFSMVMSCPTLEVADNKSEERLAGGQDCWGNPIQHGKRLRKEVSCITQQLVNFGSMSLPPKGPDSAAFRDIRLRGGAERRGPCSKDDESSKDEATQICGWLEESRSEDDCCIQEEDESTTCASSTSTTALEEQACPGSRKVDSNVNPQDMPFMEHAESATSCNPDFCVAENNESRLIDMAGPFPVYACPQDDGSCLNIGPPAGPSVQFSVDAKSPLGEGSVNRMCQKLSSPKLRQTHISTTHGCMLCGEDISWVPKVSACPYCGYKALPDFKEKPYDEDATAEKILFDHLENPVEEFSYDLGSCDGGGQCDDKTSEAFESVVREYNMLKQTIRQSSMTKTCKCPTPAPVQTNNPLLSSAEVLGPNAQELTKVFTELRNLFKTKTEEEAKNDQLKDICTEACNVARSKMKKSKTRQVGGADSGNLENDPKDPCYVPKPKKKRQRKPMRPFKSRLYSMYQPRERPKKPGDPVQDSKIPGHMGWLWTAHPLAAKPGWRPGAIRRSTRELMRYFLVDYPVDSIPVSKYMSYYHGKKPPRSPPAERAEDLVQVPTLHIEKKNDIYTITLRPLKDANTLAKSANPYVKMKPLQFRIVKNPLMKELRDLKRCLKGMGFSKCTCHKPVMTCYCRSFVDKKRLVYQLRKECERRHIESCEDEMVLSETSDSEEEFEFGVTPPAGLMHPERLKSKHVTNTNTQYDEADWANPSYAPNPPNPYVQYCSCVMGDRKEPFKWIYGKGIINPEPKKPIMRNLPKKKKKAGRRQEGGYAPPEFLRNELYRDHTIEARRRVEDTPPVHSTDSELPLSAMHMRLLDRAAYPPSAPQRQEPWARELELIQNRKRVQQRKLVRFDNSAITPHVLNA